MLGGAGVHVWDAGSVWRLAGSVRWTWCTLHTVCAEPRCWRWVLLSLITRYDWLDGHDLQPADANHILIRSVAHFVNHYSSCWETLCAIFAWQLKETTVSKFCCWHMNCQRLSAKLVTLFTHIAMISKVGVGIEELTWTEHPSIKSQLMTRK